MKRTQTRRRQRGSTILAVLPISLVAAGMVLLNLTQANVSLREQEMRRHQHTAVARAQSMLALAQAQIKTSAYNAVGNVVLRAALDVTPRETMLNEVGNTVHVLAQTEDAEVWVSHLTGSWYQLDAVARVGNTHGHVRALVRERDPWTRFYAFTDRRSLGATGISSGGEIHTNRYMRFYYPDTEYTDPVTATEGFYFYYGATPENTSLPAGSNPYAENIPMPDLGAIADRAEHNSAAFNAAWAALGLTSAAVQSAVEFHLLLEGDSYSITIKNKYTGDVVGTVSDLALPETGVIYVPMDISGLKGTLNGKLTIATQGKITLTGSLQYVDDEGDTAYLNGIPENPETDEYQPNPEYDGSSSLGIMAYSNIHYHNDAPDQMEHNAYFFSANGSFGVPSSSYPLKSTLRRIGGVATKYSNVGAWMSRGTVFSGFPNRRYFYDDHLVSEPPPHFLEVDRPLFAAIRVVTGMPGANSGEGGFNLADIDIGDLPGAGGGY